MNNLITKEFLDKNEIDTSIIKVCKTIRRLAKLDRLKLDETTHRSGLNKHLFDYIEYCGKDVLEFVKEYMSNLQPYMIERDKEQEKEKTFICLIDNLYRVSIYLKIDNKQYEEVVVSFHENNKRGIAKTNSILKKQPEYVMVFADSLESVNTEDNRYIIKLLIQRGLKIMPLTLPGVPYEDCFIVRRRAIEMQFLDYCNEYVRDLYTSDLDLDYDSIEPFSFLQQISFTSYGRDTFSSLSILIDSVCVQRDYFSKQLAGTMLTTFASNLKLTYSQAEELKLLLDEKYKVTSIKGIDSILNRIKDSLDSVIVVNTVKEKNIDDLDQINKLLEENI